MTESERIKILDRKNKALLKRLLRLEVLLVGRELPMPKAKGKGKLEAGSPKAEEKAKRPR